MTMRTMKKTKKMTGSPIYSQMTPKKMRTGRKTERMRTMMI